MSKPEARIQNIDGEEYVTKESHDEITMWHKQLILEIFAELISEKENERWELEEWAKEVQKEINHEE